MPDYEAFLDAIYGSLGIAAELDLGTTGTFDLTVIDKTEGVLLEDGHGLSLATSKPAVCVRVSELIEKGFSAETVRDDVKGAEITSNGGTWKIVATQPKPKPNGHGELYLILQEP